VRRPALGHRGAIFLGLGSTLTLDTAQLGWYTGVIVQLHTSFFSGACFPFALALPIRAIICLLPPPGNLQTLWPAVFSSYTPAAASWPGSLLSGNRAYSGWVMSRDAALLAPLLLLGAASTDAGTFGALEPAHGLMCPAAAPSMRATHMCTSGQGHATFRQPIYTCCRPLHKSSWSWHLQPGPARLWSARHRAAR
jgi:hypothetical protein